MNAPSPADAERTRDTLLAVLLTLLAAVLSLGWFHWDGNVGLNLADEGYLWYGVEAVARGEVPMRDFQAYDPGRYLWGAAWRRVLGTDVVALRLSCVLFQILGVTAGLLTARRLSRHWFFLCVVALLLCVWMHPRYKCFEQSIALMAVYAGVLLIEQPTMQRHLGVGIFTGLMAVMGRNHGVYCLIAFGLLIALAAQGRGLRGWAAGSLAWALGIVVGYLPQLLMLKLVPGYWPAFQKYLIGILTKGSNLPAAVPWPWRVDMSLPNWTWLSALLTGCFFVVLPLFLALALVRIFRLERERVHGWRVLAAATCVTLPYAHFAFSRPDLVHLGHAMPTLSLGLIAAASSLNGAALGPAVATMLLGLGAATNLFQTGLGQRLFPPPGGHETGEVRGVKMIVGSEEARLLECGVKLARDIAAPDEEILFLPNLPGLYAVTGRTSPIRHLYFIFPAELKDETTMIRELEEARVQWVMLRDYATDGRDELRFRNTNPLMFAHLSRYFAPFQMEGLPTDTVLLRRHSRSRQ